MAHEPKLLFLDEPTAGVDVDLRRDMWRLVRSLREAGTTIILTTHYIDEAEDMADRVGVIRGGELILVEAKAKLMAQLGRKRLVLELTAPLAALPATLDGHRLQLARDGHDLVYTYGAAGEGTTDVAGLLADVGRAGLAYRDLRTSQSTLEDIFVDLVRARP